MRAKVSYQADRRAQLPNIIIVLLLWVPVIFLIWLNVMFNMRIINDYLAPLYNLFNIEYTSANSVSLGVLTAALLVTVGATIRLAVYRVRGQNHA